MDEEEDDDDIDDVAVAAADECCLCCCIRCHSLTDSLTRSARIESPMLILCCCRCCTALGLILLSLACVEGSVRGTSGSCLTATGTGSARLTAATEC